MVTEQDIRNEASFVAMQVTFLLFPEKQTTYKMDQLIYLAWFYYKKLEVRSRKWKRLKKYFARNVLNAYTEELSKGVESSITKHNFKDVLAYHFYVLNDSNIPKNDIYSRLTERVVEMLVIVLKLTKQERLIQEAKELAKSFTNDDAYKAALSLHPLISSTNDR